MKNQYFATYGDASGTVATLFFSSHSDAAFFAFDMLIAGFECDFGKVGSERA